MTDPVMGKTGKGLTMVFARTALLGYERMQAAYRHAIQEGYCFYSYGDASLLLPKDRGG